MASLTLLGNQNVYEVSGFISKPLKCYACFGNSDFYKYRDKQVYKILLNVSTNPKLSMPNFCPFTDAEIERHIHELDYFLNDSRKLKLLGIKDHEKPHEKYGWWAYSNEPTDFINWKELNVEIEGTNKWHRMFMIWVRYLYESPFQFAMWDAYRLSEEWGINPFESVQVVLKAFNSGNTNHTLYGKLQWEFMTRQEFLEKFNELPEGITNYCDNVKNPSLQSIRKSDPVAIEDKFTINQSIENIDSWFSEFGDRKIKYKGLYERISKIRVR